MFPEYGWIQEVYGTDTAKRSGVPLINHIDEGLEILDKIGASELAKKAYCLHPIYQGDETYQKYTEYPELVPEDINPRAIELAIEYRRVANAYLSYREIGSLEEIELSPMSEVNDMLVADKVQNYKDFLIYHYGTHDKSVTLFNYFNNWFKRLGLMELTVYQYCGIL